MYMPQNMMYTDIFLALKKYGQTFLGISKAPEGHWKERTENTGL